MRLYDGTISDFNLAVLQNRVADDVASLMKVTTGVWLPHQNHYDPPSNSLVSRRGTLAVIRCLPARAALPRVMLLGLVTSNLAPGTACARLNATSRIRENER